MKVPECSKYCFSLIQLFSKLERSIESDYEKILIEYPYKKLLRRVLEFVYNPYIRIGFDSTKIRGFELKLKYKVNSDERLKKFISLIFNNPTIKSVTEILSDAGQNEFEVLSRILDKDLLFVIPYHTINNIFPNLIPIIPKFMGISQYNPDQHKIEFPVIIEPYLSGVKLKFVISKEKSFVFSSNMLFFNKLFESQLKYFQLVAKNKNCMIQVDAIVDLSGKNILKFNELCDDFQTEDYIHFPEGLTISDININIYDLVLNNNDLTLFDRKSMLNKALYSMQSKGFKPNMFKLPYTVAMSIEDIKPFKTVSGEYPCVVKQNRLYNCDDIDCCLVFNRKVLTGTIVDIILGNIKGYETVKSILVNITYPVMLTEFPMSTRDILYSKRKKLINKKCSVLKENNDYKFLKLRLDKGVSL